MWKIFPHCKTVNKNYHLYLKKKIKGYFSLHLIEASLKICYDELLDKNKFDGVSKKLFLSKKMLVKIPT